MAIVCLWKHFFCFSDKLINILVHSGIFLIFHKNTHSLITMLVGQRKQRGRNFAVFLNGDECEAILDPPYLEHYFFFIKIINSTRMQLKLLRCKEHRSCRRKPLKPGTVLPVHSGCLRVLTNVFIVTLECLSPTKFHLL